MKNETYSGPYEAAVIAIQSPCKPTFLNSNDDVSLGTVHTNTQCHRGFAEIGIRVRPRRTIRRGEIAAGDEPNIITAQLTVPFDVSGVQIESQYGVGEVFRLHASVGMRRRALGLVVLLLLASANARRDGV